MPMNAWLSKRGKLCHGRQFGLHPDEVARLLGQPTGEQLLQAEQEAKREASRKAFAEEQERIRAAIAARRERKRYEQIAREAHAERTQQPNTEEQQP
jgi:hypothetical protein